MKTSDFLIEIKKIDERLDIVPNHNNPGLSNIKLNGRDICPIPSDIIKEEPDPFYNYTFSNGMMGRHKSKREALDQIHHVLNFIKTDEGKETFFS